MPFYPDKNNVGPEDFDDKSILLGNKLFSKSCVFQAGVNNINQLPDCTLPEVAFIGRSNVGKSSLINALTNHSSLARVSQNPGCTKQINFFNLDNSVLLADLPGYGFARVSKEQKILWDELIISYLKGRQSLKRAILLIDIRRGIKESDQLIMKILTAAAVVFEVVLTKIDKTKESDHTQIISNIEKKIVKFTTAFPRIIRTSAEKKVGIDFLRAEIALMTNYKKS